MRGFSKAIIAGNLTRDPELRSTSSGNSVCSFAIAVNRVYRDQSGENKEDVSYIDCSAWGKPGEIISQYAKRGSALLVSGRLSQHSFEDKNGVKRSRTEIVVEDFNFINGGNTGPNATSAPASSSSNNSPADIPDDIPEEVDLSEVPF
ncbi:single-stranded DNA-binding protein [Candidatus Saccharibacteria bacterium]|nr:single-stranded DNA-binding protein [Candidatus Saccharibacteria bacterium]